MRWILKAKVGTQGIKKFTTLADTSDIAVDIISQYVRAQYDTECEIVEVKPKSNE